MRVQSRKKIRHGCSCHQILSLSNRFDKVRSGFETTRDPAIRRRRRQYDQIAKKNITFAASPYLP